MGTRTSDEDVPNSVQALSVGRYAGRRQRRGQFWCFRSRQHGSESVREYFMMNRAVFLDRDGTLIAEKNYLSRPEQVEIIPGVAVALGRLQKAGFRLFMVSNQSGVGRGYFTLEDVERVHLHLIQELGRDGVRFDKIYVAPEAPDQPSRGRKPSPQFLYDAGEEFGIELGRSFIIGDKLIDLQCGWNAGVEKSLLVRTGYGAEVANSMAEQIRDAVVVDDLGAAADWILRATLEG